MKDSADSPLAVDDSAYRKGLEKNSFTAEDAEDAEVDRKSVV